MSSRLSVTASIAVAVSVILTGPAVGQPAPGDVTQREAQVRDLIIAKLGSDGEGVRVTLTSKKAILTGEVQTRAVQELAKEVALSIDFVKRVDNQVAATGDSRLGERMLRQEAADAGLEASVKKALADEIGKHARAVEVEAVEGWVSLRGPVPDRARYALALEAASSVQGVAKVVDLLTVVHK